MKETRTEKVNSYTCDRCHAHEDTQKDKPQGWIAVQETEAFRVRLFEMPRQVAYESFHVPERVERTYCSGDCAMAAWTDSLKMLLAEMRNVQRPAGAKPLNV